MPQLGAGKSGVSTCSAGCVRIDYKLIQLDACTECCKPRLAYDLRGKKGTDPDRPTKSAVRRPSNYPLQVKNKMTNLSTAFQTETLELSDWIAEQAEPFDSIENADLSPLMKRIGEARIVLIGEASHGTSEFYRMRQRITAELIEQKGFRRIGIEGDWPDVEWVDEYVRARNPQVDRTRKAFDRFPTWMWRNRETADFVDWLRSYNQERDASQRVAMHGLDLYSLYQSIHAVLEYLEQQEDRGALESVRSHYANLLAYEPEPQDYGRAVHFGMEHQQQEEVVAVLKHLFQQRLEAANGNWEKVFNAEQNARVVANAEEYYRSMFRGGRESWNLRDSHMYETLQTLLDLDEDDSKIVVWAHNSHIGDARATEMGQRGEHNIGQLAREDYGDAAYAIGFGTHTGTVAAADDWGGQVKQKAVNGSQPGSHERTCHQSGHPSFLLPLRPVRQNDIDFGEALERAIGVIYRPQSELVSHYFDARLEAQFDEYVWFDFSHAVTPLSQEVAPEFPAHHPFLKID